MLSHEQNDPATLNNSPPSPYHNGSLKHALLERLKENTKGSSGKRQVKRKESGRGREFRAAELKAVMSLDLLIGAVTSFKLNMPLG